jgi:tripeptide aminopeptidase
MINEARLLENFLTLVRIDSPSGEEGAIAQELAAHLNRLGLSVHQDTLHNIVARLPGQGEPILLAAHMDTVMPGRGVKPVVRDGIVYSDGTTILGSDDKSGIAIILEILHTITERNLPHPTIEVLLTVREEVGLAGAKGVDKSLLQSKLGVSFDTGGVPGSIVVSAPSHNLISAVVHGKAAHAGAEPELGINAILVAARALMDMPLGRLDDETTANIGTIKGGLASNIVPDRVELLGEARSRQLTKLEQQTAKMVKALQVAADHYSAKVDIEVQRAYDGYNLTESDATVSRLMAACRAAGIKPALVPSGGGSDANILNASGIQVVNLSTGMRSVHTVNEQIAVADMVACARIVMNYIGLSLSSR